VLKLEDPVLVVKGGSDTGRIDGLDSPPLFGIHSLGNYFNANERLSVPHRCFGKRVVGSAPDHELGRKRVKTQNSKAATTSYPKVRFSWMVKRVSVSPSLTTNILTIDGSILSFQYTGSRSQVLNSIIQNIRASK